MRICFFSVLLFISLPVSSQMLSLSQGVGVTTENFALLAQTSLPLSVARSGQRTVDDPVVRAFYYSEDGGIVYSLSERVKLYATQYSNRNLIGSWPLSQNVCSEDSTCRSWWNGRWAADETLEAEVIDTYHSGMGWADLLSEPTDIMGCMQRIPLRYGDINQDEKAELVILLANGYSVDFVIFSTEKNKTIFAGKLDFNDAVKPEDVPEYLLPEDPQKQYQYWLRSGADLDRGAAMRPALKSFAKLYFGQFDGDSYHDILMWRKLYESRLLSDPVRGFSKKEEVLVHYKLIDGEYKKQPTEPSVIQGWLNAKSLTWQKGYPSKSECPGQADQLIPEMHDPLLNDPDVLQ